MNGVLELTRAGVEGRLKPFSLRISLGERVCLLGRSGAGKSSLLSLANGSLQPDQGTVHWNGTAVHRLSKNQRRAIGTLWQQMKALRDPATYGLPQARVASFWGDAVGIGRPEGMVVGLPKPRACADWAGCVGYTRPAGECVCYV